MNFSRDDRGVSEVLGAILVFGLVISLLSVVQLSGVPALNEQVEFEHNARVQDDMRSFGIAVDDAAATGRDRPVDIETGVRYPPRLFLLNPGPTAGTLATTGDAPVTFGNLRALDTEAGEYLNGNSTYTTTGLVYQPAYNEYTVAPETRYENGVIYNVDDDDGVSVIDGGALVTGRRISLTTLDGDVATSAGDAVSLTLVPVSGPSSVVSVTNAAAGQPLTLTIETNLSQDTWNAILAEETDTGSTTDGRYITSIQCISGVSDSSNPCDGPLTITFEEGFTYDLRMARVGLSGGVGDEGPAYVTTVSSIDTDISENGGTVAAAVRDRFNNPVVGANVTFYSADGTFAADVVPTDADGIATTRFLPGDVNSTVVYAGLNRSVDTVANPFVGEAATDYVSYEVSVTEANVPTTVGEINPVGTDALVLTDVQSTGASNGNNDKDAKYRLTFENTGSSTLTLTEARVNFYFVSKSGNNDSPNYMVITDTSDATNEINVSVRGDYVSFPNGGIAVGPDSEVTFNVTFKNGGSVFSEANNDDFFIVSLVASGSSRTYFAVPGVSAATGGSGGTMNDNVSLVPGTVQTVGPNDANLTFDLENTGLSAATIDAVRVAGTSLSGNSAPQRVLRSGLEFSDTGGNGVDEQLAASTSTFAQLDSNIDIAAGGTVSLSLGEFQRNSGTPTALSGSTVTVVLRFTDGSELTVTLQP